MESSRGSLRGISVRRLVEWFKLFVREDFSSSAARDHNALSLLTRVSFRSCNPYLRNQNCSDILKRKEEYRSDLHPRPQGRIRGRISP